MPTSRFIELGYFFNAVHLIKNQCIIRNIAFSEVGIALISNDNRKTSVKDNFVEIWHGDILTEEPPEQMFWALLSKEEKHSANNFTRQELKHKYIKTRGILRTILGNYLNSEPQNIIIKIAEHGKPFLADIDLYFNLSHTANMFAVAISNTGEIGIDLEIARARQNLPAIVKKCFSETEGLYWNALPDELKISMFFRFWVRKEAFVKAVGRGIALGLEHCEVDPLYQDRFLNIPGNYGLASDWKIIDIPFDDQSFCAVVMKNRNFRYKKTRL